MSEQVTSRADRLIARLRTLQGNVALFSHGQFGRALAARWIGLALLDAQHFALDTGSLSILAYAPHHPDVPVITQWNVGAYQTAHEARGPDPITDPIPAPVTDPITDPTTDPIPAPIIDPIPDPHPGDTRPLKQVALERWENEGGE